MTHLNKRELVIKILRDNQGSWMNAAEIARMMPRYWASVKDVSNILKEEFCGLERVPDSYGKNTAMRYRYNPGVPA